MRWSSRRSVQPSLVPRKPLERRRKPSEDSSAAAALPSQATRPPPWLAPESSLPSFERPGSCSTYTRSLRRVSDSKRTRTSTVLRAGSVL